MCLEIEFRFENDKLLSEALGVRAQEMSVFEMLFLSSSLSSAHRTEVKELRSLTSLS
jgi:hypothetical protein